MLIRHVHGHGGSAFMDMADQLFYFYSVCVDRDTDVGDQA